MFGQAADSLPNGEPLIAWTGIEGGVRITARSDGRLAWTGRKFPSDTTAGVKLLRSTLTRLVEAGASFAWPPELAGDSVVFDIDLASPSYDRAWKQTDPSVEEPEPIFAVAVPWMEPARYLRGRPNYPPAVRGKSVAGRVDLVFVVDTSGRADLSTVRDLWPPGRPDSLGSMGATMRSS
jgi:hypothetical protein